MRKQILIEFLEREFYSNISINTTRQFNSIKLGVSDVEQNIFRIFLNMDIFSSIELRFFKDNCDQQFFTLLFLEDSISVRLKTQYIQFDWQMPSFIHAKLFKNEMEEFPFVLLERIRLFTFKYVKERIPSDYHAYLIVKLRNHGFLKRGVNGH